MTLRPILFTIVDVRWLQRQSNSHNDIIIQIPVMIASTVDTDSAIAYNIYDLANIRK